MKMVIKKSTNPKKKYMAIFKENGKVVFVEVRLINKNNSFRYKINNAFLPIYNFKNILFD